MDNSTIHDLVSLLNFTTLTIDLSKFFNENDVEGFERYLMEEQTTIPILQKKIKPLMGDFLLLAIEKDRSLKFVKFIIEKGNYQNVNYTERYGLKGLRSPLFSALLRDHYDIAELLMTYNADVNSKILNTNILTYLYSYGALNQKKLKYVLNHNFNVKNIDATLVNNLDCEMIELIFDHYKNTNSKLEVRNDWYSIAIDKENYEKLTVLIKNDRRGQEENFKRAVALLECYDRKHHTTRKNTFLRLFKQDLHNSTQLKGSVVDEFQLYTPAQMKQTREVIMNMINHRDIASLETFVVTNKTPLCKYNTEDFDVLIYAIEANLPLMAIKAIKRLGPYHSFNYSIKAEQLFDSVITSRIDNFKSPLTSAICNERFEIANYLLENGASLQYNLVGHTDKYYSCDILHYLYRNRSLNNHTIEYILVDHHKDFKNIALRFADMTLECMELGDNETAKILLNRLEHQYRDEWRKKQFMWYKPSILIGNSEMFNFLLQKDYRRNNDILVDILKIIKNNDIDDNAIQRLTNNINDHDLGISIRQAYLRKKLE